MAMTGGQMYPERVPTARRSVARTLGRYLGGAVLVAALVVTGVTVRVVLAAAVDQRERVDAIVVLGAAQYNGAPSDIFAARLDHALDLFRSGVGAAIVTVGGGQEGDTYTEAEAGRNYLLAREVPAAAVLAAGEGADTLVSLRAGAELIRANGWTSVVVVTDPWHAYRAGVMAADLGLQVRSSPVSTGPATSSDLAPRYIVREVLGTLYYRLVGGSSGFGTPVL